MMFGPTPVDEAVGAILAHGVTGHGFVFKRGRVLSPADLGRLRDAGHATIVVARLEEDDVAEDEAAARIARAIAGPGLVVGDASTGRCNLRAVVAGLAVIDERAVHRINRLHEALTVATVAPDAVVRAGARVATVKIIPFAAPAEVVAEGEALAARRPPVLRLAGFRARRVGLIQTRVATTKESVLESTVAVTAARLAALGGELASAETVEHTVDAVVTALHRLAADGCDPIIVAGASAILDRLDVVPAALTAVGGDLIHLGMPVEPGNLLLLGRLGDAAVIGLPGCARSPVLNGADWVLRRLFAGLPIGREEIVRMGVGGLLAGSESGQAKPAKSSLPLAPGKPRVAAIVLAAGQGARAAPVNKLLTPIDGRPVIVRAVEAARGSAAEAVFVVVGHEAARVRAALEGQPVTIVTNDDHAQGLSSSLRAGLAALPESVDAAIVLLGDMPYVSAGHIDRLIARFDAAAGREICVPLRHSRRGNPVLWGRRCFDALAGLSGDRGGRTLFGPFADRIVEVPMNDDSVLIDIDTPYDLARARAGTLLRGA
jgi:molybdenum cofactor cytidylyltransferase